MRRRGKSMVACALFALLVLGAVSCGGGSSSSTGSSAQSNSGKGASEGGPATVDVPETDKEVEGKARSFGKEADAAEREAASEALESFLKAHAAGDYAAQCRYTGASLVALLEKYLASSPQNQGGGCAAVLATVAEYQPKQVLQNNMSGPISSLRVAGKKGFALYEDAKGAEYAMPMVHEGDWKVANLHAVELSGSS